MIVARLRPPGPVGFFRADERSVGTHPAPTEMKSIGEPTPEGHEEIGRMSVASGDTTVVTEPEAASRELEGEDPSEVLRWALNAFESGDLVLSTSFGGVGGIALIHMLHQEGARVPVFFVDTLYHFPETLELAERVRERYDLDLQVLRPARDRKAFEAEHGPRLWERDLDRFHRLTKVEPMEEALAGVRGWITGRRRDQSETRRGLPVVEERPERVKINPLAAWSGKDVWAFVQVHGLPYNPLHDHGYPSVGDRPLTTPAGPGEEERAGRWRGLERLECGLHDL